MLIRAATPALALAALAAASRTGARATYQEGETVSRIERRLAQALAEESLSALSVALDVGGETLFAKGQGEHGGRPVEAHSAFPAGSLTAQWIAAGVMEQVERGTLRLEARVGEYLGEFAEDPRALTVEHLLARTSGLPPIADSPAVRAGEVPQTAALLSWLRETPPEADPGTCLHYSDSDTLLLGLLFERFAGSGVRAWIEKRSADLELEHLRYTTCEDRSDFDGGQEVSGRFEEDGGAPAQFDAQALEASVLDLVAMQRAFVEGRLVSESDWALMTQGGRLADGSPTHYGLGFGLGALGDRTCVRYGGRARGARLLVAWYPELDLTVALMAEGDDVPLARLERCLVRALLDEPDPELREFALTPEELEPYLGDYYWGCTRLSIVLGGDGRLRALTPEPGERVLLAQGRHLFVAADDPEVHYRFEVEGERAVAFVLDEHGSQTRAVRID